MDLDLQHLPAMAGTGRGPVHRPVDRATANPVLVVGNSFDPATPYQGAQKVADLLPNSTLLTYAGWGHTAFGSGNYCVDSTVGGVPGHPPDTRQRHRVPTRWITIRAAAAQRTQQAEQGTPSIQAALIPDIVRRAMTATGS